ncbi:MULTISPECIES: DUF1496 domain-containing protein [unclassified Vibrio]|uniref:DUF1496 domain-containing protein n=1 Tax=unclassified Vibrio TaxID=2614977 RepID=UPI001493AB1E|nr:MULTISPECIES: DUF1496 domain-containing protein [unclassified Vibrio]
MFSNKSTKLVLLFSLVTFSWFSSAKVVSTPNTAVVVGLGSDIGKRVCYYQDKSYSVGALLKVGDYYMICKAENAYETNGALKWFTVEQPAEKQ